jgi:putative ABC transport system ATP-binding protein
MADEVDLDNVLTVENVDFLAAYRPGPRRVKWQFGKTEISWTVNMIRIENLEFHYPQSDFCLRVPELSVEKGSKVALIGPSGSGKTTLLNLMAGICMPLSGRVVTGGIDVTSLGDADRRSFRACRVGLVFQEFELLDHLTILDNILLVYRISPVLKLDEAVRERAAQLAQDVGIGDKLCRFVRRLSQGERQRVAVCRALLTEPRLLLCDEPTGNLDPANKGHVLDILVDYVETTDATMVAVTHDHQILSCFDSVVDFGQFHRHSKGPS